jgi:DNA (cytosine-5)-methyltransferase 1
VREGLRLFGFPEWYKINQQYSKAYDLLGNSVVVPVIAKVAERLLL